jgi:transposase InsO family protein
MKKRNPRFGCRRIAMQISNTFGVDIDHNVVWRVLKKNYKPVSGGDGPSWLSFIGNTKDSLWSVDFFRCESIWLKSHWVMVVMDQYSRQIIGFSTHCGNLDGATACFMFNKIIGKQVKPNYLSSDNDPLFEFHRWKANLRIYDIEEIKSIPHTPTSHPFIERLIRICRNIELLDQTLFWTSSDLQQKLDKFKHYFNEHRTHMGINGKIPVKLASEQQQNVIDVKNYRWQSHCRGLFQLPIAA